MENTSPSDRPGAQRYRVLAVEPDERLRTRMTLELAGIVPSPLTSIDDGHARARAGRADRGRVRPEPRRRATASRRCSASRAASPRSVSCCSPRSSRCRCCRRRCAPVCATRSTIDAGERQIRQAVERVGETMSGVVEPRRGRGRAGAARQGLRRLLHQGWRRQERRRDEPRGRCSRRSIPDRVVLVDGDLQFGDVAVLLGVPPHAHVGRRGGGDRHDRHAADGRLPRDARGVVAARAVRAGRAGRR